MRQLYPKEIIVNSGENYFESRNSISKVIHLVLLLLLFGIIVLLPIVTADITSKSSGQIRSRYDDNILQLAVYGEISRANIAENMTGLMSLLISIE